MSYLIRIMYGKENPARLKRFRFDSKSETSDIEFDKAVKEINEIYATKGRFSSQEEVLEHFKKYGFSRISI